MIHNQLFLMLLLILALLIEIKNLISKKITKKTKKINHCKLDSMNLI